LEGEGVDAPGEEEDMFISLEGIEGSGKTTALSRLVTHLERRGHVCKVTREPGGTPFGRRLRSILLDPDGGAIDPKAEMLLYCADRVQHVHAVIQPALDAGAIVVCDRYLDATLAYQGGARGLGMDLIRALHGLVLPPLMPDLTFLFDLDPQIGLQRAWAAVADGERHRRESRFEAETLAFHEQVRTHYLALARAERERFVILDAARPPEDVIRQMVAALADRWPACSGGAPA
jgi:dTMP kinase